MSNGIPKVNTLTAFIFTGLAASLAVIAGCGGSSSNNIAEEPDPGSVAVVAEKGVCTSRSGSSHAATIMFFDTGVKNVIATSNEVQKQNGVPVSQDTDITFDVWKANGPNEGECLGNITVHIDGGTNERAQVAIEDYLDTPDSGQGVMVRTGQLDARSKFDTYVDINEPDGRSMIWNNFTGMPNTSRLMSSMRFVSGQHLAIYFTGDGAVAEANIQLFKDDGTYVGVAKQQIGKNSAVVTDDVRSLTYIDTNGATVTNLPADGEAYLKILGSTDSETEASCMVLYSEATPNAVGGAWSNSKLTQSTLTFARRNGGNDPLALTE